MAFVATTRLRWGNGWIEPGEPVPEGENGRDYLMLLRLGLIQRPYAVSMPGVVSQPAEPEAQSSGSDQSDTDRGDETAEAGSEEETVSEEFLKCPYCDFEAKNTTGLKNHIHSHKRE